MDSGRNSNLSSEDMDDLWRQGIVANDNNDPDPEKIPVPGNIPFKNWKRRTVGDMRELFFQGDQTIYTTPMLISIIILVRR